MGSGLFFGLRDERRRMFYDRKRLADPNRYGPALGGENLIFSMSLTTRPSAST
jgi:hypothetical protein